MKATKIFLIGALGFVLSGCVTGKGIYGDVRLDSPVGSAELRAACADRAAQNVLVQTGIWALNIAASPVAGATAGTALANPLTQNISAKCDRQAQYDANNS